MSETASRTAVSAFEYQQFVSLLPNSPKWVALYTTPRHEKRVAQHLASRGIEYFLPLYRSVRKWAHSSSVILELPLFPNYVFVHITRREKERVLEIPGIISIVTFGRELAELPEPEIEALRSSVHLCRVEPHPYLVVGERVRIKVGLLIGMEGVLIRQKNTTRVVLTLDLIRQSIAVEVDADDLEPVSFRTV